MNFKELCEHLENKIQDSYNNGVTSEQAEALAGEFLYAQLQVSSELKKADLDSRMRKTGVKAVRAAIYMDAATKTDKKPSDVLLEAVVNQNEVVQGEQNAFDKAEVSRDELSRLFSVFKESHIHFRGIAKGRFE